MELSPPVAAPSRDICRATLASTLPKPPPASSRFHRPSQHSSNELNSTLLIFQEICFGGIGSCHSFHVYTEHLPCVYPARYVRQMESILAKQKTSLHRDSAWIQPAVSKVQTKSSLYRLSPVCGPLSSLQRAPCPGKDLCDPHWKTGAQSSLER